MNQERFEVYRGKDGWRWRLRAANSQIVATGEAHTRKRDAVRACQRIADLAGEAANVPLREMPADTRPSISRSVGLRHEDGSEELNAL